MLTKLKRLVNSGGDAATDKPATLSNGSSSTNNHVNALPISLQRKFARGVSYNLKIIVKGDRNVGKSALLDRMQHFPFCEEYTPTEEIKVANINWDHKLSEEVVKVELWEVVDKSTKRREGKFFEDSSRGLKTSNSSFSVGNAPLSPNIIADRPCMALDAESIDVYRGASGVIVIIDLTKKWTVDYLQREIVKIPSNLPVLVLANHKDMYHHAVVTPDQVRSIIAEINSTRLKTKDASEPPEGIVIYAESSMRNCFGLKFIDKFFSIPFLYLQRATLQAQLLTNARDLRAMQQELNLDQENYEIFLDQLTNKRRAAADEHGKQPEKSSLHTNLSVGPEKLKISSVPKTPPPGTSIAETVSVKELMSNPKYKIEYPTVEAQVAWQQQNEAKKPQILHAEQTKGRPSIIIGRGKPIPGSENLLASNELAKSFSATDVTNSLGRKISENDSDSENDDDFQIVLPDKIKKSSRNNPMVAHSQDDSDGDDISVDYQQATTTAGEALDAAESKSGQSLTTQIPTIAKRTTMRKNVAATDLFGVGDTFALDAESDAVPTTKNDAEALEVLAQMVQQQSEADGNRRQPSPRSRHEDEQTDTANSTEVSNTHLPTAVVAEECAVFGNAGKEPQKVAKFRKKTATKSAVVAVADDESSQKLVSAKDMKKKKKKVASKKSTAVTKHDNGDSDDEAEPSDLYKDYEPI